MLFVVYFLRVSLNLLVMNDNNGQKHGKSIYDDQTGGTELREKTVYNGYTVRCSMVGVDPTAGGSGEKLLFHRKVSIILCHASRLIASLCADGGRKGRRERRRRQKGRCVAGNKPKTRSHTDSTLHR